MYRLLVVLRTVFLLVLVVYAIVVIPMDAVWGSYITNVDVEALRRVARVLGIALAWIAFETVVGWILWSVRGRRAARDRTAAAIAAATARRSEPPSAPPPPPTA